MRQRRWAESQTVSRHLTAGVVAAPMFVGAFTWIGATRSGYDWHRHAVSSLACGNRGWTQRANFIVTGLLYCAAAQGLGRASRRVVLPTAVPIFVGGVGVGLIGSVMFVTDPVGGFPPDVASEAAPVRPGSSETVPSRAGTLHNLSALPIFVGIPVAGLASAIAASRDRDYQWAAYSAGSSVAMAGSFMLFAAAIGGNKNLAGTGGVFQRISIAVGFGWLSALSLRTLRSLQTGQ
jgi:hypothetical protein